MNRNGLWLVAAVLALVGMGGWAAWGEEADLSVANPLAVRTSGTVKITMASSSTKKEWIESAVRAFNAASRSDRSLRVDGRPVVVEVVQEEIEPGKFDHYRSGTMVADVLSGKIQPTIVSPAEESWIQQLKADWKPAHGSEIITGVPAPLVRTPLVLALWQSRAVAMGCWPAPGPDCTWQRLRDLASSPDGWGMLGHPEWGHLKFGYGYVGESNSGTLTSILLCMIGAGRTVDLTIEDVDPSSGCGNAIATVEKAKVHSGKKSSWLLGWMKTGGPEYLDAVTTYEQDVIAFNRENGTALREPLVAAYPQDGTVVVEHPFAILDGAPWVTPQQARAAEIFQGFLLSDGQQRALQATGLRPANPGAKPGAPIELRFGANPEAGIAAVTMPDPLVLARITEVWHRVKKHAVIALVFDKSGSMQGQKLTAALAGTRAFVEAMDPEDSLIWLPFDERLYAGPRGLKAEIGERLVADITSTSAAGGTALYDAIAEAYRVLEEQRKTLGDSARYGIVVLSDGQDTASRQASLSLLRAKLAPTESDPTGIQIHTIGIGNDADKATLSTLAAIAHGKFWDAKDPSRVLATYREIAVHY